MRRNQHGMLSTPCTKVKNIIHECWKSLAEVLYPLGDQNIEYIFLYFQQLLQRVNVHYLSSFREYFFSENIFSAFCNFINHGAFSFIITQFSLYFKVVPFIFVAKMFAVSSFYSHRVLEHHACKIRAHPSCKNPSNSRMT